MMELATTEPRGYSTVGNVQVLSVAGGFRGKELLRWTDSLFVVDLLLLPSKQRLIFSFVTRKPSVSPSLSELTLYQGPTDVSRSMKFFAVYV
jgi:hypothetical protein